MPRYYFDSRDNEAFIPDEDGVEIATLDEVKLTASRAMADLARALDEVKLTASRAMADFAKDVLPGSVVRILTIEVRDEFGPVLLVSLRFEIEHAPGRN
jgi:hypothetical protein